MKFLEKTNCFDEVQVLSDKFHLEVFANKHFFLFQFDSHFCFSFTITPDVIQNAYLNSCPAPSLHRFNALTFTTISDAQFQKIFQASKDNHCECIEKKLRKPSNMIKDNTESIVNNQIKRYKESANWVKSYSFCQKNPTQTENLRKCTLIISHATVHRSQ